LTAEKFTLHRVEQFGNHTLGFIPNLRVLIYRERKVNYLNNFCVIKDLLVIVL